MLSIIINNSKDGFYEKVERFLINSHVSFFCIGEAKTCSELVLELDMYSLLGNMLARNARNPSSSPSRDKSYPLYILTVISAVVAQRQSSQRCWVRSRAGQTFLISPVRRDVGAGR